MKRGSGVILPIFSLPHSYGIGTLGHEAYNFVNFLEDSSISYWQLLPIGQTSLIAGNSPYSSISSFAGNPYFIDYEILFSEGLIEREDYINLYYGDNYSRINYELIDKNKHEVLEKAYKTFKEKSEFEEIDEFFKENEFWLRDYCLYMTLRKRYGIDWSKWPREYSHRDGKALEEFWNDNFDEINFYIFVQFKFFSQYYNLKKYANEKGIEIIGDLPIYVAFDSADCWAYSKYFQLDDNFNPKRVSGAKPDAFNEEGQLWGHPLYDWEMLKDNNYEFWLDRMNYNKNLYDIVRLDHFIGFINYYAIEVDAIHAKDGVWVDGPGIDLFNFLENNIDDLRLIVEDLGVLTEEVLEVKDLFNYPGMNVIQFAFSDYKFDKRNLPHNYVKNSAVYSSTHDSDTFSHWLYSLYGEKKYKVYDYLFIRDSYMDAIKYLMSTTSDLCIFSFQDLFGLDNLSRINIPGIAKSQWEWRIDFFYDTEEIKGKMRYFAKLYDR